MRSDRVIRTRLLFGASIAAALALPGQAFAQDTQPGAESDSGGLAEIVVTAQRREENLRDVPISINAITGDSLKNIGVGDTSALVQAVPSLNFTRSGPSGIFVIRGVATPNGASGEEGSTAVYVDDVYMPDLASTINTFNNIQRIEVLNGPQGTLFGRNATGGLIRVITREPGQDATLEGLMGYGNYGTFSGQLYAAAPLSDKVAMDFAFTGQVQTHGFGVNETLGGDARYNNYAGFRSKLVANLTDTLKVTLGGDYYWTHDTTATLLWPAQASGIPASQNTRAGYDSGTRIRVWGVSGKVELDLGSVALTSITSYRRLKNHSEFDVDGDAPDRRRLYYDNGTKSFQQELRIASTTSEPFSWQFGAFYLHTVTDVDQYNGANNVITSRQVAHALLDSISVFGEATYAITPTTHLTGGVRWTKDKRGLPIAFIDTFIPVPGIARSTYSGVSYSNVTYRAALRQDLSDTVNVYASVNKGFKSGQFNLASPLDAPVRPQTIMAYEVGLKGDFLDRHLRVGLAAYHYDIDDYQIRTNPGGGSRLGNAAKVKIDGIDLNLEAAVTEQLRFTAGASLLNARYTSFPNAVAGTGAIFDATGRVTALAPRFSLNLGASYTIPLGEESELRFTANYVHKSSYVFEPDGVLRQPAYDLVNASVEYKLNEHAAFEFYARNIGDELYNVQMTTSLGQTSLAGTPRQYGANFKFNF